MTGLKLLGQILGPLLFGLVLYYEPFANVGGTDAAAGLANPVVAVAGWMLIWWVLEAVPLAVTSLLPMLLFPLLGVMTPAETAGNYADPIVYLFFGGFVLALGLEHYRLHLRIALWILRATGISPRRLVLGFMLSTAVLSMWISNTATTVMMLPMALSVLQLLNSETDDAGSRGFAVALLLGIAFAANVGGMATLIGTPPNLVFAGVMQAQLGVTISFGKWMLMAFPIATVLFVMVYWLLTYFLFPMTSVHLPAATTLIRDEQQRLGEWQFGEYLMLGVFVLTAGLWIGKETLLWYWPTLGLTDTLIALAAVVLLFVLPGDAKFSRPLMTWDLTTKLPWGILLLFGGGLCLAAGLGKAGVISAIASWISPNWPYWLVVFLLTGLAIYLTEVMSNVALVGVYVPVLIGIAAILDVDPLYLAIPATLSASCAFMLPMATPPNAIVFASGKIQVWDMFLAGTIASNAALLIITPMSQLLIFWILAD